MSESEAERLTRIETKLDIVVTGHASQLVDHEARLRDVQGRAPSRDDWTKIRAEVDELLKFKWTLIGAAALASVLSSALTALLVKALGG